MASPFCLLTVHAHPDDESSKGAGTIARYHAEGVRTVLVCCTGGEEGEVLNPAMDRPEVMENLHEVRMTELAQAADAIGYDEVVMLGYRDSGMPDTEANRHPDNFANAPLDEAVDRLVEIVRRERPQVIVTYPDDQGLYQHPDHLRVHDITVPAFHRAGDESHRPNLGSAWSPTKLYYSMWSRKRIEARHAAFIEHGIESPYDERWFERPSQDDRITTRISIEGYEWARSKGLLAHATQVDPESKFWFGLPEDVEYRVHPFDDYVLAIGPSPDRLPEEDLFAGIAVLAR